MGGRELGGSFNRDFMYTVFIRPAQHQTRILCAAGWNVKFELKCFSDNNQIMANSHFGS